MCYGGERGARRAVRFQEKCSLRVTRKSNFVTGFLPRLCDLARESNRLAQYAGKPLEARAGLRCRNSLRNCDCAHAVADRDFRSEWFADLL